ncbi:MAG: alkene reductase [Novosphingobium sp.]|nr:alkene reductase [Novosphingobium sp.]MBO9601583.1 alkene reductase [Novosphingobium sp.]
MTAAVEAHLLRPIRIGGLELPNRIAMSPMTRGRTPGGSPNALNATYYSQRASAGLVFAESTAVSAQGVGFTNTPGIFTGDHAAGWKGVTDAVHARGGKMVLQLWHSGRNSHSSLLPDGAIPIGPSAVPVEGRVWTHLGRLPIEVPRAIGLAEIPGLIEEHRQAAILAMQAGFDAVEIHAGNAYLIDQFLRDSSNRRTDRYGGSPLNRMRFLLEVVDAVADVWGTDRVGVRISPTNPSIFGIVDSDPEGLFFRVAEELDAKKIAFLDVVEGATAGTPDPSPFDFRELRSRFSGVYIANNNYTFETGNQAIAEGHADMVAFGRPYIANPDLVERFASSAPLTPLREETLHLPGEEGYTDYPFLGSSTAVAV